MKESKGERERKREREGEEGVREREGDRQTRYCKSKVSLSFMYNCTILYFFHYL